MRGEDRATDGYRGGRRSPARLSAKGFALTLAIQEQAIHYRGRRYCGCSGNTHLTRSRVRCGFKCGREAQSKGSKLASTIAQDKLIFDRVLASLVIERDRSVDDCAHAV